jgi:hypothetical protein
MSLTMIHKFSTLVLSLFLAVPIYAQVPNSDLTKRVLIAPESVFKLFREAEMFEPMKNKRVKKRLAQLEFFYKS